MRLIKLFLLILIAGVTSPSFAATRIYQLDLLIVSHVTTKALLSENWPANFTMPLLSKAVDLKPYDTAMPNALYQILPADRSKFAKEVDILNKQAGYHVLVDMAWLQPALTIKQATWIHVSGGTSIQVNGMLKISRPYLFQADADLVLTIPAAVMQQIAPNAIAKIATTQFVLKQTASVRANQIYYFDHPLFGVILRITPLDEKVNELDLT
ncbi:MAG: hypothetical protein EXR81_00280 [Gammaproteobacteria bacterium]|nr:hypothetical protein [Gammaproteobacteria bacterium]